MIPACLLAGILVPSASVAEFDLPILFQVPKTISVPKEISLGVLPSFAGVKDLTIEVRMTGGNMLRDVMVKMLNEKYRGVTKRIVFQGEVNRTHVDQIRRLDRYEVVYQIGKDGLGNKTFNSLYALGPVRKFIEIPEGSDQDLLNRIGKLKFYVPVLQLGSKPLDSVTREWIFGKKHSCTQFSLPADIDPSLVYDLLVFNPISLRVKTVKNHIPVKLFNVLKDLKGGVKGMKLAFAESVFWENVHSEIAKAVRESGKVFEELGARVDSIEFAEAEEAMQLNAKGLIIAAEAYTLNKNLLEEHFDRLDPNVAHRMIKGKEVVTGEYLQNILTWKRLRAQALKTLKDVDALLVPTTMIPALPVADVDADADTYTGRNINYLRNTSIGNTLNLCGLNLPCGFTVEGLPIGLMVFAKPFQESVVLRIGYAFQQLTDWHQRQPDLSWAETI